MITQVTTLLNLSQEKSLRYDVDYIKYRQNRNDSYYSFNDLFSIELPKVINEDALFEDFAYCEIGDSDKNGDISPVILNFEHRNLQDENYYKKIENGDIASVNIDDILISKVRPNLKKYVRITDEKKDVFFTTAFIRLRAKEMPDVLYYCLRTVFYEDLMAVARQGKGYPTISEKDLPTLRFDGTIINKLRANRSAISAVIDDVERKITSKASSIVPVQTIIDSAFQNEFGFDYGKFNELKARQIFKATQVTYSNNPDLRFSVKYHRPAGSFVMKELNKITDKKIKHFLAEPIVLGASISNDDYDENGDYSYISMATIKNWVFDPNLAAAISNNYSAEKAKKTVRKNDIILARSGEGTIGKVALITDDLKGVFADFTMRIRLDESRYSPLFAYYFMRSCYFQYLIEINKKGLGNNTNIFPIVVQELPLPDISLENQLRIVNEIQEKIKEGETIKTEIETLRRKIESAILAAVS